MSQPNQTFRVTLTATLQAGNPIEAAHMLSQVAGKPGFDKFQVADENGETNVVDMGLLIKMGVLRVDEVSQEAEAVEAGEVEAV